MPWDWKNHWLGLEGIAKFWNLEGDWGFPFNCLIGDLQELFDESQLNRKLQVLIQAYPLSELENETEYIDQEEVRIQNLALGWPTILMQKIIIYLSIAPAPHLED